MSTLDKAYKEIEGIIGSKYITEKDFMKAAYSRNVDPAFPDRWADMIVRPVSSEEVSAIVQVANKFKIPMVPRGGGADLVGGSVTQGGILLDLTRMNNVLQINEENFYCEVEAGITWGTLISILHEKGLTTGVLGPGSGYSATIGGGLSNSTAGFGSTKYGVIPDICLGVEAVLPNPQGSIIRTGAATNKYAEPFCRYGVAPDFTGLFMGDVGIMGIKTKAFLKLFPVTPFKAQRYYILNKNDYNIVSELLHRLRTEVRDGLHDVLVVPLVTMQLLSSMVENKPVKRPRMKGPVFSILVEAMDERILDVFLEQVDDIMKENARKFELQEVDLDATHSRDWKFDLKYVYNYFNKYISVAPPKISCTTCHKVPISAISKVAEKSAQFDLKYRSEFPVGSISLFATVIFLLPNGNCVIVGGFNADNIDEQREASMKMWHKKIRLQVRYGGVHYWLGEAISQSIVEADAYTPDFIEFFKNMKKTVDPNFLLSPNKFHMYNYDDEMSSHIVKED
ncbi:MAG: FAD-binding oxidoreductase [Promethearchaeota archaeon]